MALQMLVVLCALAKPAYAYIDPGSGLLACQIMGTTLAGFVFIVRKSIRRLFRTFLSGTEHSIPKNEDAK
jgi:hypothetical protein